MNREFALTDALVNTYLDAVTATDGSPLSLIVPEDAGSKTFPLIAAALKQMEGKLNDLVVLISSTTSQEIQVQDKGQLNTPLGALEVDQQTANELVAKKQRLRQHLQKAS